LTSYQQISRKKSFTQRRKKISRSDRGGAAARTKCLKVCLCFFVETGLSKKILSSRKSNLPTALLLRCDRCVKPSPFLRETA
jgi:hypothetical protein